MSENLKCPCCGCEMAKLEPVQCLGWVCNFQCNPEDLPRIASAMDVMRLRAEYHKSTRGGRIDIVEAYQVAFRKAMEVFGK